MELVPIIHDSATQIPLLSFITRTTPSVPTPPLSFTMPRQIDSHSTVLGIRRVILITTYPSPCFCFGSYTESL